MGWKPVYIDSDDIDDHYETQNILIYDIDDPYQKNQAICATLDMTTSRWNNRLFFGSVFT